MTFACAAVVRLVQNVNSTACATLAAAIDPETAAVTIKALLMKFVISFSSP
jgi:hypothetical protein